jgi:hypothetical protein
MPSGSRPRRDHTRTAWRDQPIAMNIVLLAVAVFVAWARFGPYAL